MSDSETLRTAAHQAPLSMGFSRREYCSGLPCPPPGGLPDPGMKPGSPVSRTGRWVLYHQRHLGSLCIVCVLVTQSCLTLCDPTDCSPPGSSVHGILQARTLEWIAISSSRGSSQPRYRTPSPVSPALLVDSLLTQPPGKPLKCPVT